MQLSLLSIHSFSLSSLTSFHSSVLRQHQAWLHSAQSPPRLQIKSQISRRKKTSTNVRKTTLFSPISSPSIFLRTLTLLVLSLTIPRNSSNALKSQDSYFKMTFYDSEMVVPGLPRYEDVLIDSPSCHQSLKFWSQKADQVRYCQITKLLNRSWSSYAFKITAVCILTWKTMCIWWRVFRTQLC